MSNRYFTSSQADQIFAYDYNLDDGTLENRRVFINGVSLGLGTSGLPDGFCFDSEGCIWSARRVTCRVNLLSS
jgi:sugar lactone lactonase YvrE